MCWKHSTGDSDLQGGGSQGTLILRAVAGLSIIKSRTFKTTSTTTLVALLLDVKLFIKLWVCCHLTITVWWKRMLCWTRQIHRWENRSWQWWITSKVTQVLSERLEPRWLPGNHRWFNLEPQQNPLAGLFRQIAGLHPLSFWFSRSLLGPENLYFWEAAHVMLTSL